MLITNRSRFQAHPFHLVSPSPWPLTLSVSLLCLTSTGVLSMHGFAHMVHILGLSFFTLFFSMAFWFRDIIAESTYLGNHTLAVQRGLNMGVSLFITSEALFFLAIFWTYFHSALAPTPELGSHWPPSGIEVINPFELPLLNTVILLCSGITVTYAHHSLIKEIRKKGLEGLGFTVTLAILFTFFQYLEYLQAPFTLSDGVYGSCFYFATAFHGIHVIVGMVFIVVGMIRFILYHLTGSHHLGFEAGILYWHFVDVVWLVLFLGVYYWGS